MKGQARPYGSQEHQGKRQKFSSAPRSRLSLAISRMAAVLDLDLLEAALGVTVQALQDILTGRGKDQESRYATHISHHLEAAGIPFSWLNDPSAPLSREHQDALLELAAQSGKKAALRRHNFKKLVKAFEGKLDVLADALEILEPSVSEIATGALPFEDQRFGHINPRLVAAGVPDGWLEKPDAEVTPDIVELLKTQAAADYEQSIADYPDEPEDQRSDVRSPQVVTESSEAQAASTEAASTEQISRQPGAHEEVRPEETVVLKKEIAMKTQPRGAKTPAAAPNPSQKEFKAAGIPGLAGATLPLQPQMGATKPAIPRGAMASGRTLGKPISTAKPAAAPAQSAQPAASKPAKKTKAPVKQAPAAAPAPAPAAVAAPAAAPSKQVATDSLDRETSLRRAAALEQLLESARRGAKVTLWRDLLKSSLGYWGNIRRGQVFLRDQLANDITTALGLPEGWLDNPVFPPPALADWVMDANVPLPGTTAPAPAPAPARVPNAAKTKGPKVGATTLTASATLQPPATQAAPAPQAPVATQAAPAPVPAPAPAQQAAPAVSGVGVDWQPATAAQPVEKLGPIVTALVSVIQDLGLQGKLTEQEALKLLNGFMAKS